MAATLFLGDVDEDGLAPIIVRVQSRRFKTQVRQKTGLMIVPKIWDKRSNEREIKKFSRNDVVMKALRDSEEIRLTINEYLDKDIALDKDMVRDIIHSVIYREQIQAEKDAENEAKRMEEERNRVTLNKFISQFLDEIQNGSRHTESGKNYSSSTVKCIKHGLVVFQKFQKDRRREYDFDDIDLKFYNQYTAWLRRCNYNINSIGKYVQQLKMILDVSYSEGYHKNDIWKDKRFKGKRIEVDSIYLTHDDLDKLRNVDLSGWSEGYSQARDIFMVGVWTAQRVSDYNNISKSDISTYTARDIVDEPDLNHPGRTVARIVTREITVINIRQQKTGAKVSIPCSSELVRILKRYNYELPHLEDQVINRYIKEIAKEAGLTELVEIETTRGGIPKKEKVPKYELIMTHTARRTGATLMYLSGMEIYDIMKITGHSTPAMLKKYIKADQLEVVDKIVKKYNYFD